MTREEQIKEAALRQCLGSSATAERKRRKWIEGAEWADAHPDISMVSALAYKAGREGAINDAGEWLKGNLHLAIDCDDEGRYHIDPNFVDYFKVRLRMCLGKGGEQ